MAKTAVTLAVAVLLGGLGWVVLTGDEESQNTVRVPSLTDGWSVRYNATGQIMTLENPLSLGLDNEGSWDLSSHTHEGPVLYPDGAIRPGTIVETRVENSSRWFRMASGEEGPIFQVTDERGTAEGFDYAPSVNVRMPRALALEDPGDRSSPNISTRIPLGLGEVFLFEGVTLEAGSEHFEQYRTWAWRVPRAATDLASAEIQTTVSEGSAELTVRSPEGERLASYRFDETCPFPRSATYWAEADVAARLDRAACSHEPGTSGSADDEENAAWRADPAPYDRRFQGSGDWLPLPYDGAYRFFEDLPSVAAFQEEHPDWLLTCATMLHRQRSDPTLASWSWGFTIEDGSEEETRWVTQRRVEAIGVERWAEDTAPTGEDGHCSIPTDAEPSRVLRGANVTSLDTAGDAFQHVLPPAEWEEDADLGAFVANAMGFEVQLSVCSQRLDESGGGFCTSLVPGMKMTLGGDLYSVSGEPGWFGAALPVAHPER